MKGKDIGMRIIIGFYAIPILSVITYVVLALCHKLFQLIDSTDFLAGLLIITLIAFIEFIFVAPYICEVE